MRKNIRNIKNKRFSSLILYIAIVVSATLFTTSCGNGASADTVSDTQTESDTQTGDNVPSEGGVLGMGETEFVLTVVDEEGGETQFEIHTDKETVGDALEELGLIEGEKSEYGLYVKTVNGITADYDTDGVYWAFYVNDEYASSGVDSTAITAGDSYAFKVE